MTSTRAAQVAVGLSLLGLLISGYLGVVHVALVRGDLLGGPLCGALGSAFNCHAATASRLGQGLWMPLAFWGVLGYLATLALSVIAWRCPEEAPRALTLLAGIGAACLVVDAGLLAVTLRQLHALCLLCLATYLINLLLTVAAWRGSGRSGGQLVREVPAAGRAFLRPRSAVAWAFWGVIVTGAVGLGAVQQTTDFFHQAPHGLRERIQQHVANTPRVSVDTTGSPRLGSPSAPVQVVTFADFLCPLCRDVARFNAVIQASRPDEVSFVVKLFPLEQACNAALPQTIHPGACQLAAAAACAHAQGKFWAFHDRVFRVGPTYRLGDLEQDAARAGVNLDAFRQCLAGGQGAQAVARDIAEGARLGLVGTPVMIVNGVRVDGTMSPSQFEELARALKDSAPVAGR